MGPRQRPGRHWEGGHPAQFSVTAEGIAVERAEGFLGPPLPVWGHTGQACDWSDPGRAVLDPSDRWTARVSDPLLSTPLPS